VRMDLDRRVLKVLADGEKAEFDLVAAIGLDAATIRDCCLRLHRDWLVMTSLTRLEIRTYWEPRFRITESGRQLLEDWEGEVS
jgi:hypothetical protein